MTGPYLRPRPVVLTPELLATAACRHETDTETLFFADTDGTGSLAAGRELCAACPLTGMHGTCVQDAINYGDTGLRGGTNIDERNDALRAGLIHRQAICHQCHNQFEPTQRSWLYCTDTCADAGYQARVVATRQRQHRLKTAS